MSEIMGPGVKFCLICDKKIQKQTHPETNSAANLYATTLTKVFSFDRRVYYSGDGKIIMTGTSCSPPPPKIQIRSMDGQDKIKILRNQLLKISYCYQCVQNIRSINDILSKIERLEEKVIDYKYKIANQFIDCSISNRQFIDNKVFTANANDDGQEQEQCQVQVENQELTITNNNLLEQLRTDVIQEFNFVDFQERYTNSQSQLSLIEKEEPILSSSNSNQCNSQQEQKLLVPRSLISDDLRINLTRIEEIPELSKYISLESNIKLVQPFIKEEIQQNYMEVTSYNDTFDHNTDSFLSGNHSPRASSNNMDDDGDYGLNSDPDVSNDSVPDSEYKPLKRQKKSTIVPLPSKTDKKLYICAVQDCKYTFKGKTNRRFRYHFQQKHPELLKTVSCEICSAAGFPTFPALAYHKRTTHNISTRTMCTKCGKDFPAFLQLRTHRRFCESKADTEFPCLEYYSDASNKSQVEEQQLETPTPDVDEEPLLGTEVQTYSCTHQDCEYSTSISRNLTRHIQKQHKKSLKPVSIVSCDICSAECATFAGLANHKSRTHKIALSICSKCGEEFQTGNELSRHRRSAHHGIILKTYPCSKCAYVASSRIQSNEHERKHDDPVGMLSTKPAAHNCPKEDCEFSTNTNKKLNSHIQQNHPELSKAKSCEICSDGFPTFRALAHHKRTTHNISTRTMCTKCGEVFPTFQLLRSHRERVHQSEQFACSKCSYVTRQRAHLGEHLKTHDPQRQNYICQYCGLKFKTPQYLKYHQGSKHIDLNLQDPDLYKCKICGLVAASPPWLRKHMKIVHFQEQCKFFCDTCGKGFLTEYIFKKHQLSHTDQRNFECEVCHAKFKYENVLKSHLQRHTGKFQYKCQTCGKEFTNPGAFQRHKEIHAGVLKYFCKICGKGFPVRNYLYIHKRSHETKEEREQRLANKKQEPLNKLYNELRVSKKFSAAVSLDPDKQVVEEYPMHYDYTRDRTDLRQNREAKANLAIGESEQFDSVFR